MTIDRGRGRESQSYVSVWSLEGNISKSIWAQTVLDGEKKEHKLQWVGIGGYIWEIWRECGHDQNEMCKFSQRINKDERRKT